jgi:hypothetical protein
MDALFVDANGIYSRLGLSCWGVEMDARTYDGSGPVVAHPPCKRWGRYARGGPNPKSPRYEIGDDDGCFASALATVRRVGGVIEHPEASHAWAHFGLRKPKWSRSGSEGWVPTGDGGWTCCVSQHQYGHRSRKLTWLLVYGAKREDLPELDWTIPKPGDTMRLEEGVHVGKDRPAKKARRISERERWATPELFARLLIQIASVCNV